MSIRDSILTILDAKGVAYRHIVHDVTLTSMESAAVRGTSMESGVKSIILRGKKTGCNYQFNLPSHRKLDMKAVAAIVKEKCDFESEAVILEKYGLLSGAVPPFGNLLGIPNYVDEAVLLSDTSAFNCGLRTESLIMDRGDLISMIEAEISRFSA
jgi:nondiscriminating aspartyl-tRNA synthetase